jgi:Tol biopolymer transport system component
MKSARRTARRIGVGLLGAAGLLAACAAGALAGNGDGVLDTSLVSRATGASGSVGDGLSNDPSLSADGRYTAFESNADDLDPDSNDSVGDVFVRDAVTGTTTLVSRATGAAGAVGDGDSSNPSISADGRYIAFESDADNLDAASNDSFTDVFVRDTVANTTTLISRATGAAGTVGDGISETPEISADGLHVAFESFASTFSADDGDLINDIFVRDTQANTTTMVSRGTGVPGPAGNNNSVLPSTSADGRYVAFESYATNLAASNDSIFEVFVRDTVNNTTKLVSRGAGPGGVPGDGQSVRPSISADGRYVAFDSDAGNWEPDSDDSVIDVFVRDMVNNTTTLVSRASGAAGAGGDGDSIFASISGDGGQVAFMSEADNLDTESNDSLIDIFVRDTAGNTTTLVSRATGAAGAVADDDSFLPAISADAGSAAFSSDAGNLDPDSNDAVLDVFHRELVDPASPAPVVIPPPVPQLFNRVAAIKRCKKKFPKRSRARKRCIKKAKAHTQG